MQPHWTQNDATVNGVRLHYYRTGNGDKRPLVLVHGFSDNGLCWAPTARDLESEYDAIMPDMRGHGLSARVRPDESVDMAQDLAGLIQALGLKRPIVCGHSMGAMVTYQIGVRFPKLARALILEDPPFWISSPFPSPTSDPSAENPIVAWAKDLPNHSLEELLAGYSKDHPDWSEEFIRTMCESKKQLDPTIADIMSKRIHSPEVDWKTTFPGVTLPTLLFAGDPELGGIVTPEVVSEIRRLNPKVNVVSVPDVGHLIRFDRFPAFMEAVQAFLEKLPS